MRPYSTADFPKTLSFFATACAAGVLVLVWMGLLAPPCWAQAQEGRYLRLSGGPQYTQMRSFDDISVANTDPNLQFRFKDTWRTGGALTYVNNFDTLFGYELGLHYSRKGQRYTGTFDAANATDSAFDSHVHLDYLEVPLLLRVNSALPDPRRGSYLDVALGLSLGYLLHSEVGIDRRFNEGATPETRDLYRNLEAALLVASHVHVALSRRWQLVVGVRGSRTIGGIEKTGFDFDDRTRNDYTFPVGVPKSTAPSSEDLNRRASMKHSVISLDVGLMYRLEGAR